jgi:hypothetical protein
VHSHVNNTDYFSFESAEYGNCFLGVSQDGNITAPNRVGSGSVSSQFRLETVSLRYGHVRLLTSTVSNVCMTFQRMNDELSLLSKRPICRICDSV